MTLTPEEIQTKQFHVRFRGFDVEEVDSFLERVAEELLAALEENKLLEKKLHALTEEIATYHTQEKTFQNAILSAQNIADEIKNRSRQEADDLLEKTRQEADETLGKAKEEASGLLTSSKAEADELLNSARTESQSLRQEANAEVAELEKEVDRLSGLKTKIQAELRNTLQSYLDQLDENLEQGAAASVMAATAAEETMADQEQAPLSPEPTVAESEGDKEAAFMFAEEADESFFAGIQEEEAAGEETEAAAETDDDQPQEDDLSDLYEKIDLTDDDLTGLTEEENPTEDSLAGPSLSIEESDFLSMGMEEEEEEDEDSRIPDLEGDMIFTLEDPLDQEEEVVVDLVDALEDDEKKKDGAEE